MSPLGASALPLTVTCKLPFLAPHTPRVRLHPTHHASDSTPHTSCQIGHSHSGSDAVLKQVDTSASSVWSHASAYASTILYPP